MGKFLLLWEMDMSRVPENPKDRAAAAANLLKLIRKDMEGGAITDWGAFIGEGRGYAVCEGTHAEVNLAVQKYMPFVMFELHPITTLTENEETMKTLMSP